MKRQTTVLPGTPTHRAVRLVPTFQRRRRMPPTPERPDRRTGPETSPPSAPSAPRRPPPSAA
jgi:hypothetical protein